MDKGIEALTPEMARESGNILIIVAARLVRKECLTPLHTLSELGQRTISTRALNDAIERAEESLSREAGKIRDGYDRLTKMLRETESALVQAHQESKEQSARIEELESQRSLAFMACNRWRDKCVAAEKRRDELESAPNGMMQLSNELAAKSVVFGELGFLENLERIISDRDRDIDIGQLGHENYQALMVAALDAFRSAAGQVKGSS